jgi:alpha-D-ribose 1-methylphosphonate 5-triphosphate synthase subunit PhnL
MDTCGPVTKLSQPNITGPQPVTADFEIRTSETFGLLAQNPDCGFVDPELGPSEMLMVNSLSKSFTLHLSGPTVLKALENISFSVQKGSCLALTGPSGSGKSTLLRCIFGNYRISSGDILIKHNESTVSLARTGPRQMMDLRHRVVGYVSQFLKVIPRVSALEVVMEPLVARGWPEETARHAASRLLDRLNIPRKLQSLPPATFSGGERQRVNVARGLIWPALILLLDEPTASLDPANTEVVCELIEEAKVGGAAVIGVFHDRRVWSRLADRVLAMHPPSGGRSQSPSDPKEAQ